MKILASVALIALTVSLPLHAQSLADAAKKTEQQRADTEKAKPTTKVYTNGDLASATGETFASLKITTGYDRMKDFTSVALDKMSLGNGLDLHAYFVYTGHELSVADAGMPITFHFVQSSNTWKYLTYRPLTLLLNDSVRMDLGTVSHDGSVGSGYVLEQMTVQLPSRQLLQIVAAQKVEGQLGLTKFTFTQSQLDALRALARRKESK